MVTFTLSQRVWVFPKLRAIRAIRVSLAYVLTCKTCVNFSFLRTNVPIKAKKLLLRMERGHKINHIYIHNIYIYIYIYTHTHVLSFPGLISVARVNEQRTTDVTRVLKAPGAEPCQNACGAYYIYIIYSIIIYYYILLYYYIIIYYYIIYILLLYIIILYIIIYMQYYYIYYIQYYIQYVLYIIHFRYFTLFYI